MLRKVKRLLTKFIEWVLYKKLKSSQKEKFSKLLTSRQKAFLKKFIKTGQKQARMRKIEKLRHRLTTLGFQEKALEELSDLFDQGENIFLKKMAGYELMTWYANQHNNVCAELVIEIGTVLLDLEKDKDRLRKLIIMLSESYQLLGKQQTGKKIITRLLENEAHPDTLLAAANLEIEENAKLYWINQLYDKQKYQQIALQNGEALHKYDVLSTHNPEKRANQAEQQSKVSIIVPAYNAEDKISTAISSLLNQTWRNIEVLVVDDCSTDNTTDIVRGFAEKDSRVKLLQTNENSGAYVARNTALKIATGEYVTINDADDWSHPDKIELQARHLNRHSHFIGNFSNQARVSNDLNFYRRGKFGVYIFTNFSSFMFRREKVVETLGYWDSVRFAGDSEYVKRIKRVFGERSIAELAGPPMSFQRQTADSLTGNSAFGFPGYFMGARQEYAESHDHYHESGGSLKYSFPQEVRPFPIPAPMKPKRVVNKGERRHFDVIIASEFRLLGGTNMSNIEEIKAQKQHGLKTGLVQLSRYDLNSVEQINPHVRETIDGDRVEMIVYGEKVSCDVLIVRHPPALQEWQKYVPDVKAGRVEVIVNQPPQRDYGEKGERLYSFKECVKHLKMYFGQEGTWYPIGPEIRKTLDKYHKAELDEINLAEEDWVNIIHVDEWWRGRYTREEGSPIRIGRHSRDQYVKWPESREKMMLTYPTEGPYEIHVLGGAKSPKKVLGKLPTNWNVKEFGEESPQSFLKRLDVFVYYTHSDWVEAFGRVIFEAMAAGVPVVIEPKYKDLFGEAAIYAEPEEVLEAIEKLMSQPERYEAQVEKAKQYVDEHFGYAKHITRITG
ncbi:glycosyltransferase [Bacillus sp. A301a_S52]|nr:glycosyltransferase [Bacillus sp. A301a_S52]